ncbi:MFS transporter [Martelella alba]|uniref:MFS transporter n=1 Tax=Martelella alba TaxID=2590451 RepID=A0ABY2SHA0_9HYPH|nr:MFS transporter [Martelella alba]TKI03734.1 MFS transporter [Martelella alba]
MPLFVNYRYAILAMLTSAYLINYIDRSALSVAMPFISIEFHLSDIEKGIIFGSFSIGYALFNFVGGALADKFGAKRVLAIAMGFWSIMCGLTAGAFSFWTFFLCRVFFGMGEGPNAAVANKVIYDWFPIKEKATAVGIQQAGGPLGGAISGPLVGMVCYYFGWRFSFLALMFIGLTWVLIWSLKSTSLPSLHKRVGPDELALINQRDQESVEEPESGGKSSMWKAILQPAILAMALSLFCYNYVLFFFITWFPTYLVDARGVSAHDMSFITSLPWLMGAIGYALGGVVIDMIYRRTKRRFFSRKIVLVTAFFISSICIAVTGIADTTVIAVTTMTAAIGLLQLAGPAYWALIQDAASKKYVGSASGLMHGIANTSGIIGPAVTGLIVQSSSYAGAFILAGVLGVIGSCVVFFLVRAKVPEHRHVLVQ